MMSRFTLAVAVAVLAFSCVDAKMYRKDCTIIKNQDDIPHIGVVSANPDRTHLIATKYFDDYKVHTDFRGYQVYTGHFKGVWMFAANTGLGSASATFLMEELVAFGADVIIRLGTNDYHSSEDTNDIFIIEEEHGLAGLFQDYGLDYDPETPIPADKSLVESLAAVGRDTDKVEVHVVKGYNVDAFYAFMHPANVAGNIARVEAQIKKYEDLGCTVRDMESAAVLLVGQLRDVKTAAVLQSVDKTSHEHESVGTAGIPVVLQTLYLHETAAMRLRGMRI